jgi:septum site-determining protein MinC
LEQIVNIRFENGFALIEVDDQIPLWKVLTSLTEEIEHERNDLKEHEVILITGARTISGGDILKLYHQLVNKYGFSIVRIFSRAPDINSQNEIPVVIEEMSRLKGYLSRSELFEARSTLFVRKNVRSGQTIDFDGHVVVYGNINQGAMVRSTGNISVFGKVGGSLWAGCSGSEDCFIVCGILAPTQLRIADCGLAGRDIEVSSQASSLVAFLKNGKIQISDLPTFVRG